MSPMSTNPPEHEAMSYRHYVAGNFRAEMARARRSARQVALGLGESHTWVNRRVNGVMPMSVDDIERIAAFLRVPIDRFVTYPATSDTPLSTPLRTTGPDSSLDTVTAHNSACAPAPVIPLRTLSDAA